MSFRGVHMCPVTYVDSTYLLHMPRLHTDLDVHMREARQQELNSHLHGSTEQMPFGQIGMLRQPGRDENAIPTNVSGC